MPEAADSVFLGLINRGLSPIHAAVLAGNIQQESGFNPRAVNPDEGANGLLQWRESRWQALQDYAKARGTSPTDRDTQLDFILSEGAGPERKAWGQFLAASDPASANAALKGFIRYGDDSGPTRLANATRFIGGRAAPDSVPVAAAAPAAGPVAGASQIAASGQPAAPESAPLSFAPSMQQAPVLDAPTSHPLPLTGLAKNRLLAALYRSAFQG